MVSQPTKGPASQHPSPLPYAGPGPIQAGSASSAPRRVTPPMQARLEAFHPPVSRPYHQVGAPARGQATFQKCSRGRYQELSEHVTALAGRPPEMIGRFWNFGSSQQKMAVVGPVGDVLSRSKGDSRAWDIGVAIRGLDCINGSLQFKDHIGTCRGSSPPPRPAPLPHNEVKRRLIWKVWAS